MSLRERLERARAGEKPGASRWVRPPERVKPESGITRAQSVRVQTGFPARIRAESVETTTFKPEEFLREDPHLAVKERIHHRLVKEIEEELVERTASVEDRQKLAKQVEAISVKVLDEEPVPLMRSESQDYHRGY